RRIQQGVAVDPRRGGGGQAPLAAVEAIAAARQARRAVRLRRVIAERRIVPDDRHRLRRATSQHNSDENYRCGRNGRGSRIHAPCPIYRRAVSRACEPAATAEFDGPPISCKPAPRCACVCCIQHTSRAHDAPRSGPNSTLRKATRNPRASRGYPPGRLTPTMRAISPSRPGGLSMQTRVFGRTGMQLSLLGFGCGAVGGLMVRGAPADQERTIARALAAGINYFDTAVQYGNGESEKNLGRVLQTLKPANVVVGTKVRLPPGDAGRIGEAIAQSLEDSLKRLRRDHVDIFHLHNSVTDAGG